MIINGIASIKGVGAAGATATFTGVLATITPVAAAYTSSASIEELKDGEGNVVSKGANNIQQRIKLDLLITGASIATAKTIVEPAPLAIVTLGALNVGTFNGTWNYESGWSVSIGEGFAKLSMECSRINGAALTAAS